MKTPNESILLGLPVHTVAEIAENAHSLQQVAQSLPNGKITARLVLNRGRVVEGTERAFASEQHAVAHYEDLVSACVDWGNTHRPVSMADASFTC